MKVIELYQQMGKLLHRDWNWSKAGELQVTLNHGDIDIDIVDIIKCKDCNQYHIVTWTGRVENETPKTI